MEALHLPKNVKVHFAGAEVQNLFEAPKAMGVSYFLYTCFPWVYKSVFGKGSRRKEGPSDAVTVPAYICGNSLHTIQDSGLFTLLFGAMKDADVDEKMINRWYDGLVRFTLDHGQPVTCVEVDCQRLLGPEKAWEFRERLRRDLPEQNRIINVFHLEDGQKGLDRMIEYSEYIAISVPEMRFAHKRDYVPSLARYIKIRKPSIDIHLLGCTEMKLARECRFATSCDSTSWTYGVRYGRTWYVPEKRKISGFDTEKVREQYGDVYDHVRTFNRETNTNAVVVEIDYLKRQYERELGPQDYYKCLTPAPHVL